MTAAEKKKNMYKQQRDDCYTYIDRRIRTKNDKQATTEEKYKVFFSFHIQISYCVCSYTESERTLKHTAHEKKKKKTQAHCEKKQ